MTLHGDEAGKQDNHQQCCSLLPGCDQPLRIQSLHDIDDKFGGRQDEQWAGNPGGESDEEAPKASERAMRPGVEPSLVRKEDSQLSGSNATGDKKADSPNHPEC